jgi:hypothetical protein
MKPREPNCAIRVLSAIAIGLGCIAIDGAETQSVTTLDVNWVQRGSRAFFKLSGDGSRVLIYRQVVIDKPRLRRTEELVLVPTSGGVEQVFYRHDVDAPAIYNNFDLSADATTVVFAPAFENDNVYVVTSASGSPRVVASVGPDEAPGQLTLSADGRWVAFSASRMLWSGRQALRHANLYVAALDGSVLHKVTPAPVVGDAIPFAFSSDGATIAWVDDPTKGPMRADRDGGNALRLPFPGEVNPASGRIQRVFLDAAGSRVFYAVLESNGTSFDGKLFEVDRNGTGLVRRQSTAGGRFEVSRDGTAIRCFDSPGPVPPRTGTSWLLGSQGPVKMFDFGTLVWGVGTYDWSDDGNVLVWYDERAHYGAAVMVWREP